MNSIQLAWLIRRHGIEMTHLSGGSHIGAIMSVADIIAVLYADIMRYDPEDPKWSERDRFILSKGHAGAAIYAALAESGFFDPAELKTHYQNGSRLSGHVSHYVPGVDFSTGSLGHGLSAAAGMAKGAKYLGKDINVYTLLGDGEIAEGEVWEAMLFAAHYHLDNFCMIVDLNGLQIDGRTCDVMNTAPVDEKAKAFGFHVVEINGHDFDEIERAFAEFHACAHKPTCILMHTTKGKGVSFMENQVGWHGKAPNDEEYKQAMGELNAAMAELEAAK